MKRQPSTPMRALMAMAPPDGLQSTMLSDAAKRELERQQETDDMIAMGWGNTERQFIPADWRRRRGPDKTGRL